MQNEKIEKVLENIKEYREDDSNFMKIYREYKIDHTTEDSKEEVLTSLIEYMNEEGFIRPYYMPSEEMSEGVAFSGYAASAHSGPGTI